MPDYASIKKLSERMGVTHKTVSTWLKKKNFPVQREGPWSEDDAVEIQVWRETHLQPNRADPAYQGRTEPPTDEQDKDYWLMRKYRAQALQQEGKLLDTDAVMRAWVQTISDTREQLMQVPASAQGLLGLTEEQTRQLDDYLRDTLDGIADRMGNLADDARFIPGDLESDQAPEAAAAERVGGGPSVHASVDVGQPRPVEE